MHVQTATARAVCAGPAVPCERSSAVWISVRAGQNLIVLRQTSAFGTLLPLQQAAIDAALYAAASALRLQELRTVTCAEG
jgi:hypothetical protein